MNDFQILELYRACVRAADHHQALICRIALGENVDRVEFASLYCVWTRIRTGAMTQAQARESCLRSWIVNTGGN